MRLRTKLVACGVVMALLLMIGVSTIPPQPVTSELEKEPSHFVISEWEYPSDEYGQGIEAFRFYENSTGAWLPAPYYTHYYPDYHEELGEFYFLEYDQDYTLNWTAGVAMKLRVYPQPNTTLLGTTDVDILKNYVRNNVTVSSSGQTIFSQNNFTYVEDFHFECILNFLPQQGQVYTIAVTYEVFY